MSLADELRHDRLKGLHTKFRKAADKCPTLYHVACRSDQPRLWDVLNDWTVEDESKNGPYREFWKWVLHDTPYHHLLSGFPLDLDLFTLNVYGQEWWGRFWDIGRIPGDFTKDQDTVSDHLPLWFALANEACYHLLDPVAADCDHVLDYVNLWVAHLYSFFSVEFTHIRYGDIDGPGVQLEHGESYDTIGLPCNVFLASAKALEDLAGQKAIPPEVVKGVSLMDVAMTQCDGDEVTPAGNNAGGTRAKTKNKGGREEKWNHYVEWTEERQEKHPGETDAETRVKYISAHKQAIDKGKRPKPDRDTLRQARFYRNSKG